MAKSILNQSFNLDQQALVELEAYAQAVTMETEDHRTRVSDFVDKNPLRYAWEALKRRETE